MKAILAILLLCAGMAAVHAAPAPMQQYETLLPHHVFWVSLPREVVRGPWPIKHTPMLESEDPSFVRSGFYDVFEVLADFNGPFWVGAYGSLTINVLLVKTKPELGGDITTLAGLERYLRAKEVASARPDESEYAYSIEPLNGIAAVRRTQNTLGAPGDKTFDVEIYSIPLSSETYLNVAFRVRRWIENPRQEAKWRPKAEAMRERIKATVRLKPADAE